MRIHYMPAISMFYGIIIYMFSFDNKKHHLPHIHVHYGEEACIVAIEDGAILDGSIPQKKSNLF
jgi:hypothetical protein